MVLLSLHRGSHESLMAFSILPRGFRELLFLNTASARARAHRLLKKLLAFPVRNRTRESC